MNYLRTKRDDKGTFIMLYWALIVVTVIWYQATCKSLFDSSSFKYDFPLLIWICSVIISIIKISFLSMLRNGLPYLNKKVKALILLSIILEAVGGIIGIIIILSYRFPRFPEIYGLFEVICVIIGFFELITLAFLGYALKKNYKGKIKKLGLIFLTTSIIYIVLSLLFIGIAIYIAVNGSDIGKIIFTKCYVLILSFLEIAPWVYESNLLIEGTKYLGDELDLEEEENQTQDIKNDTYGSVVESNSIKDASNADTPLTDVNSQQADSEEEGMSKNKETSQNFNSKVKKIKSEEKSQGAGTFIISDRVPSYREAKKISDNEKTLTSQKPKESDYSTETKRNRNKVIVGVSIGCIVLVLLIVCLIIFFRAKKTGGNAEEGVQSKQELIVGDFDGDGEYERLWIEGGPDYDNTEDDIPIVLRSDNPKFDGMEWNSLSANLFNLGNLDDSGKDYLGVLLSGNSNWAGYNVYAFDKGWYEALEPFSVYWDIEVDRRVEKSKTPGYVTIYTDEMFDDGVRTISKDVTLNKKPSQIDKMTFTTYQIETFHNQETRETRYFLYPGFAWTLEFQPDKTGNKVSVLSSRLDAEDFGAGRIDNGRLKLRRAEEIYDTSISNNSDEVFTFGKRKYCVRKNAPLIADVNIDDIEQFITEVKSDWDPERTVHNIYIEQGLYNKIDRSTHEMAYKSKDGMKIKIKLYKIPGHVDGVKAIVSGEIENPSDALINSYEDEFSNSIYSVLTDNNYFYSEFQGEGESALGPRVEWSEDELKIKVDPNNERSDIILKAVK